MFLIHATNTSDDNGVLALFAEDYNFATLWYGEPQERDADRNCGTGATFDCLDELQKPILC